MMPLKVSLRSARAGSIMTALGAVIVIEAVVLHLLLAPRHPWIGLVLTLGSVSALVWLVQDYRAMKDASVTLDRENMQLDIGRRATITLPRAIISAITRPSWRDLPTSGTPEARTFVNLTKPAEPNLLVTLREPVTVVLFGAMRKRADRIGLHVDEPDRLVAAHERSFEAAS